MPLVSVALCYLPPPCWLRATGSPSPTILQCYHCGVSLYSHGCWLCAQSACVKANLVTYPLVSTISHNSIRALNG